MKVDRAIPRQKTLLCTSRGVTHAVRHLVKDLHALLPHAKKESKLPKNEGIPALIDICQLRNCQNALYFEVRKRQDVYLWLSRCPTGPSIKFQVHNIHTSGETHFTGNCLLGSRPMLVFDGAFDSAPHLHLTKQMLMYAFGVPQNEPGSKPFVDHILSFHIVDNMIHFRNYQISTIEGSEPELIEIGPRFTLEYIKLFEGSFGGNCLMINESWVSPNEVRRIVRQEYADKYVTRTENNRKYAKKHAGIQFSEDQIKKVFSLR
ncbi:hypothetical protein PCE1_000938 [Barthelona sp. PCE]